MLFWNKNKKRKTDRNSEFFELLRKFEEVTKKPGLTPNELNEQYRLLLKPAMDHKPESRSKQYWEACEAQEKNFYRTFYRISPGYRDKEYAEKINNYRNIYNIMLKKENQNDHKKRYMTDSLLKKDYKYLCTELYRYGNDKKYQELNREFYRLRNLYYNDLKGKNYYAVTIGEIETSWNYENGNWVNKKVYNKVYIRDEEGIDHVAYGPNYHRLIEIPIYAVDDERGLRDVITGDKVCELKDPDINTYSCVWYTKLDYVDEQTVASNLTFLVDERFLRHNKKYKSNYAEAVKRSIDNYLPYFKEKYDKMIQEQKAKEKQEKETAKTLKLLNKNL